MLDDVSSAKYFLLRIALLVGAMAVVCQPSFAGGRATQKTKSHGAVQWPVVYPSVKPDWPVVYPDDSVSILLAGDTGFGGHGQPVRDGYGMRQGRKTPYAEMTNGIAALLTGDAAFANLETVISDHNGLRPASKRFVFRTHPSGVRHLNDIGFNLFSTSNNHVGDYRTAGIRETLNHISALQREGRTFVASGLGRDRDDAATPKKLKIKNAALYLSAIGIGGGNANARGRRPHPGHLHYRTAPDFADAVARLSAVKDGYRMLSVHYGQEGQVYPSRRDIVQLRDKAVGRAGIDLVIGHHAHVPRGIARVGDKLIFYGLGNFLHPGMQDMGRFGRCRDFGLVARVHLGRTGPKQYKAMAVEVIPVTDMHQSPGVMSPGQAKIRVGVLNGFARGLDSADHKSQGVRFALHPAGHGVACFPGSEHMNGVIGGLCAVAAPGAVHSAARQSLSVVPAVSCGGRGFRGASYRGSAKRRKYSKRQKRKRHKKTNYFNPFGY